MRDSKGRIIAGSTLPVEMAEAISQGQMKRWAEIEAMMPYPLTGKKKCTRCGEVKSWDMTEAGRGRHGISQFGARKRTMKTGTVRYYPNPECKSCAVIRTDASKRAWMERDLEGYRQAQREANDRRDDDARRRYQREYGVARRQEAGAKSNGGWKKYREERERENRKQELNGGGIVSIEPLWGWLLESGLLSQNERYRESRQSGNPAASRAATMMGGHSIEQVWDHEMQDRLVYARQQGTITLRMVDRLLSVVGREEMMGILYGEGKDRKQASRENGL